MGLAAALGLQNFRHFVGGGVGGVLLEVAGNGEDGVAHTDFGHAVRAAGGLGLAGGVGHRLSFLRCRQGQYWPAMKCISPPLRGA